MSINENEVKLTEDDQRKMYRITLDGGEDSISIELSLTTAYVDFLKGISLLILNEIETKERHHAPKLVIAPV